MSAILTAQSTLTMSSKEIAALTGKEHRNVLRDARAMLVELHGGSLSFEQTHRDPQNGQMYPVLALPKRETLVLVSGYSVQLRARIIDRWQELEASQAPVVPQTLAQALRLAADQADQIEQQAAALALAAPKVAFVERYVEADTGLKGFRQVAKLLRANETELRRFLTDEKIMYRLGGEWVAHQQHLDAGRFEMKTGEAHGHAFNRCLFTPKGVEWIAARWAQRAARLAMAAEAG